MAGATDLDAGMRKSGTRLTGYRSSCAVSFADLSTQHETSVVAAQGPELLIRAIDPQTGRREKTVEEESASDL